jgi:hypothetical protein
MLAFFRLLGLIRMAVGMMLVIDGTPLIYFAKQTLKIGTNSSVFTALVLVFGFVLMIPFSILRRLYRYNTVLMMLGIGALLYMIFYMLVFSSDLLGETNKDLIYFAYVFIFLFLLVNLPNDVLAVFVPVVIVFTLVSNLALVYSLIRDPTWVVGQRAAILIGDGDDRSGNPHAFARNALMGIIACGIWTAQPRINLLFRVGSGLLLVVNTAILIATQTRSSVLALIVMVGLFAYFNLRPAQIRQFARGLVRPWSLVLIGVLILSMPYVIQRNYGLYSLVAGYAETFFAKNIDNVYALLGLKASGVGYTATLDDSAANRSVSITLLSNILLGHQERLLFGYGYKAFYLDVPIVEALVTLGLFGFLLYGSFVGLTAWYSLRAMRYNFNPMSTFLAYFFVYLFVTQLTNGRPNEISYWHPFCLMIRFLGVETRLPAWLWTAPADAPTEPEVPDDQPDYATVSTTEPARS